MPELCTAQKPPLRKTVYVSAPLLSLRALLMASCSSKLGPASSYLGCLSIIGGFDDWCRFPRKLKRLAGSCSSILRRHVERAARITLSLVQAAYSWIVPVSISHLVNVARESPPCGSPDLPENPEAPLDILYLPCIRNLTIRRTRQKDPTKPVVGLRA